jgi:hypothetical protein
MQTLVCLYCKREPLIAARGTPVVCVARKRSLFLQKQRPRLFLQLVMRTTLRMENIERTLPST